MIRRDLRAALVESRRRSTHFDNLPNTFGLPAGTEGEK